MTPAEQIEKIRNRENFQADGGIIIPLTPKEHKLMFSQLDAAQKLADERLEALKKTPSGFSFTEWAAYCADLNSGYAGEKSAEVKEIQKWFSDNEAKRLVDQAKTEGGG